MYLAWGSVAGEKERGGSPWIHQCLNITLVYSIVLGHSKWLWNPITLGGAYTFQALRSKKCKDLYLFRGISHAHLLLHERCRAAGNEQTSLDFSARCVCVVWGGIYAVESKMKHLITALGIPLSCSAHLKAFPIEFKEDLLELETSLPRRLFHRSTREGI